MGRRNRDRRREKRPRRMRFGGHKGTGRANASEGSSSDGGDAFDRGTVETAVLAAARAFRLKDDAGYRQLLSVLTESRLVDRALTLCLERALGDLWRRGWQPADVVRVSERQLSASHARLAAAAIVGEAVRYPASAIDAGWQAQLRELAGDTSSAQVGRRAGGPQGRDEELRRAVETLSLLLHLPGIPCLCPPPGEVTGVRVGRSLTDERVLGRVRALLAKAESTTFPDEAEALTAKAQELMARHAVDQALLDARGGSAVAPSGRRLPVQDPYSGAKALMLSEVATANRCRSVWSKDFGFATVFGHDSDIGGVELLYTSLLVQANAAMTASGRQVDGLGRSRTRSFRQSFLVAFATRIGARLREATEATESAAVERHGASLVPVLAARTEAVDEACDAAFPGLVRRSFSSSNPQGWLAGLAAAELASLSAHPQMDEQPARPAGQELQEGVRQPSR